MFIYGTLQSGSNVMIALRCVFITSDHGIYDLNTSMNYKGAWIEAL